MDCLVTFVHPNGKWCHLFTIPTAAKPTIPSACHGFANLRGYGLDRYGYGWCLRYPFETHTRMTGLVGFSVWLVLVKVSSNSDKTLMINWYSPSRQ
jgi:hypothetical protein